MKSLLSALVILMFLAHLVTGNWYVKKCANKMGNCRNKCRDGERQTEPATSKCPVGKLCCILDFKITGHCGGGGAVQSSEGEQDSAPAKGTQGTGTTQAAGAGGTPAAGTTAAALASTAAP